MALGTVPGGGGNVVPVLEQAGHRAFALTLTGECDRVHLLAPSVDLATHVMNVVNTLEMEDLSEVVLVGHSYGGNGDHRRGSLRDGLCSRSTVAATQ